MIEILILIVIAGMFGVMYYSISQNKDDFMS